MVRRTCYLAIVVATFTASLLWLSTLSQEPDFGLGDVELQPLTEREWRSFLQRRSIPLPALSLAPWNASVPTALSVDFPVLLQYPPLPYDDAIACLPKKFGYSQEQADILFNPNRRYPPCGDPQAAALHLSGK